MPVAQGGPAPLRQALVVGVAAVLGILSVLFLVTQMDRLIGGASIDLDVGDGIYRPGDAADLADAIGGNDPLLLPDLAGGDRDLFLNYTGVDDDSGDPDAWHAIAARQPTSPRRCSIEWQPDDRTFTDSCDGTIYPEDGAGLPRYPVRIDGEGQLQIDLSSPPDGGDTESE